VKRGGHGSRIAEPERLLPRTRRRHRGPRGLADTSAFRAAATWHIREPAESARRVSAGSTCLAPPNALGQDGASSSSPSLAHGSCTANSRGHLTHPPEIRGVGQRFAADSAHQNVSCHVGAAASPLVFSAERFDGVRRDFYSGGERHRHHCAPSLHAPQRMSPRCASSRRTYGDGSTW